MALFYLSLGSNLGDREAHLAHARERIVSDFERARFSPLYETEPVGVRDQPWFLNQTVEARTSRTPESLLQWGRTLETERGRTRQAPGGARTLDVDVLLYDDRVLEGPSLILPHPRLLERRFVLVPLMDLAPELRIPPSGITVRGALDRLGEDAAVRPFRGRDAQ
jgi:2-amino-4-hydroxy-6-hydroxymethyldihydropteridine diphosphokinase